MTTVSTCWMSVFARAMSWPVWALVVEREVQPLQVGEQPLAQVGLGAQRDAERGVAPQPGADRLHHADQHHARSSAATTLPLSPWRIPSSMAAAARSGTVSLASGPDDAGADAAGDPPALRADRAVHEAPTGAAGLPLGRPGVRRALLCVHAHPSRPRRGVRSGRRARLPASSDGPSGSTVAGP